MKFPEVELPSNRKFGIFFSVVFIIVAAIFYFYFLDHSIAFVLLIFALVTFIVTYLNPNILLPLNKLWMRFGLLLGMIISPIIMGVIFFGLFTPYSIVIRIMGRDELHLKRDSKKSHWIDRCQNSPQTDFKKQF